MNYNSSIWTNNPPVPGGGGGGTVDTFTIDGGTSTTDFSSGLYLLVDFGGSV